MDTVDSITGSEPIFDFFYNFIYKNDEVGDLIRQAREEKCLTQKQLASLSGISAVQLCRIENNECIPSQMSLKAISAHIGISYSFLQMVAGYNHSSEKILYTDKEGSLINTDSIIASMYYADPELLMNFRDVLKITDKEDILILNLLLKAMRKEKGIKNEKGAIFIGFFSALKKFIVESMMPFLET